MRSISCCNLTTSHIIEQHTFYPISTHFARPNFRVFIPSIDKNTYGFDWLKCVHAALKPLRIRQYALRTSPCLNTFELCQNCEAPVSKQFSSDFRLSSMQVGCRPSKRKRRKAPKRNGDRRVCPCRSKVTPFVHLQQFCAPNFIMPGGVFPLLLFLSADKMEVTLNKLTRAESLSA